LTIFLPFFSFFAAFPLHKEPKRDPKKLMGSGVAEATWGKNVGEGPHILSHDRTPDICIRSLFGFRIVQFGIAAGARHSLFRYTEIMDIDIRFSR
jgi:hypothetical protein